MRQRRLMIGAAASTSVLGLAMTSGLVMLASRLVEEFSHPHVIPDIEEFNLNVPLTEPEPPRSLQRPLTFQTRDGKLICGDFWAQPQPAPTIILCHGYRASRVQLRSGAAVEYKFGYNVLFFDFRGHGDSDSVTTSGGNVEVLDLEAAIAVSTIVLQRVSPKYHICKQLTPFRQLLPGPPWQSVCLSFACALGIALWLVPTLPSNAGCLKLKRISISGIRLFS